MSEPIDSQVSREGDSSREWQGKRAADTDNDSFIEIRNLKSYYGGDSLFSDAPVKAVDDVTFDIERGETLALVGESGCGKTTLGHTLVKLKSATDGKIRFSGTEVTELEGSKLKKWRRNSQVVFQDPESSLDDRMTIGELIREPLDVHDWPNLTAHVENQPDTSVRGDIVSQTGKENSDISINLSENTIGLSIRDRLPLTPEDISAEYRNGTVTVTLTKSKPQIRRDRVRGLLETVGLKSEHYYRYPHQFSGGQRQRIGIARALSLEPDFVVLDEPVSALDVSVQAKILNLLSELQSKYNLTYLIIAHDLSVVRYISDRVAVMYLGKIMELGETAEVFQSPSNPYTRSLLSAIPRPDPMDDTDRIALQGTPPSPRNPPEGCPLSTRCPMKIRNEDYSHLDEDIYNSIEMFREVLRERSRTSTSISDRVRRKLGLDPAIADIREVKSELFSGLDLPMDVEQKIDDSATAVEEGKPDEARKALKAHFGSVCDRDHPDSHVVSESGRFSHCHRHRNEYESPNQIH